MNKQFIIANWKSHKNEKETHDWLEEFQISLLHTPPASHQVIILCPPFPLLPLCHNFITRNTMPVFLGSQTISSHPEGTFTGEVSARLLHDYVTYTLIGHSERRRLFHETEEDMVEKVQLALSYHIQPILLVSEKDTVLPQGVDIVIYEPPSAISSDKGKHPERPQDVEAATSFLKQKNSVLYVLYGGSVTSENIQEYTRLPSIDGVIVGGESLSPQSFASIVQHA